MKNRFVVALAVLGCIFAGLALATAQKSEVFSYLGADPKACVNCHVMDGFYATWEHGSHGTRAGCVDCHLPHDGFANYWLAKATDGLHHAYAFTFGEREGSIKISESASAIVQNNCEKCHPRQAAALVSNSNLNGDLKTAHESGEYCWRCHREVPHSNLGGINVAPNTLGARK